MSRATGAPRPRESAQGSPRGEPRRVMMGLLMWRWSTTAQTVSALLIAVFFLVLAKSATGAEARFAPRSA